MGRTSNEELVDSWIRLGVELSLLAMARHQIEAELITRMQDVGATAMDNPVYDVTLKTPLQYDRNKLHPLRELVPPEVVAEGYTPEHKETVTVGESWNMTKVKTWAKYGKQVKAIIEGAAFPGTPKLTIKAKG